MTTGNVATPPPVPPPVPGETKPGTKTTEFYGMLAAILLPWLTTFGDNTGIITVVPDRYRWVLVVASSFATALSAGLYAIGRGQAKQGIPYQTGAK